MLIRDECSFALRIFAGQGQLKSDRRLPPEFIFSFVKDEISTRRPTIVWKFWKTLKNILCTVGYGFLASHISVVRAS